MVFWYPSCIHQRLCIWLSKADFEGRLVKEDLPAAVWLGHFGLIKIKIMMITMILRRDY